MYSKVEGTHMGFLMQIMVKQAQQKADGRWEMPRAEVVQEAAETQLKMTHIGDDMEQWHSGWRCSQFLMCVQERRYTRGDDANGTHGGIKRPRVRISRTSFKSILKLIFCCWKPC